MEAPRTGNYNDTQQYVTDLGAVNQQNLKIAREKIDEEFRKKQQELQEANALLLEQQKSERKALKKKLRENDSRSTEIQNQFNEKLNSRKEESAKEQFQLEKKRELEAEKHRQYIENERKKLEQERSEFQKPKDEERSPPKKNHSRYQEEPTAHASRALRERPEKHEENPCCVVS